MGFWPPNGSSEGKGTQWLTSLSRALWNTFMKTSLSLMEVLIRCQPRSLSLFKGLCPPVALQHFSWCFITSIDPLCWCRHLHAEQSLLLLDNLDSALVNPWICFLDKSSSHKKLQLLMWWEGNIRKNNKVCYVNVRVWLVKQRIPR